MFLSFGNGAAVDDIPSSPTIGPCSRWHVKFEWAASRNLSDSSSEWSSSPTTRNTMKEWKKFKKLPTKMYQTFSLSTNSFASMFELSQSDHHSSSLCSGQLRNKKIENCWCLLHLPDKGRFGNDCLNFLSLGWPPSPVHDHQPRSQDACFSTIYTEIVHHGCTTRTVRFRLYRGFR